MPRYYNGTGLDYPIQNDGGPLDNNPSFQPITIFGFFWLAALNVENTLVAKYDNGLNRGAYVLRVFTNGSLGLFTLDSGGTGREPTTPVNSVPGRAWFSAAGQLAGAAGDMNVFVNGVKRGTLAVALQTGPNSSAPAYIGRYFPSPFQPMKGGAFRVAVWFATLTQHEIMDMHWGKEPRDVRRDALRGYFCTDEIDTMGPTIVDSSFRGGPLIAGANQPGYQPVPPWLPVSRQRRSVRRYVTTSRVVTIG